MAFTFKQGDRPLDGYTIQRGVGRGGFGEVYYAISDGGKEIALKYLRDNPAVEVRGVTHCLNLKSPHLIALHDVKQNNDAEWFVVMEFVAGPSLRDLLMQAPSGLGIQKAAFFFREVAKGLSYLHDRGIVHRDLKPGNIFYDEGYVKIGDYGLSKAIAASQHSGQTMSVGSVHYMAPEVGSGNYSKTIDIYSMGVMLYEMLLGRVPFEGASMGEILMKHLTAQAEVDALPAPFPHVIRKALAKDPNDRYQTINEMVNEVFAQADLEQSVNSLEPASISMAAERAARHLQPAGMAGGSGGGFETGSSNIGAGMAETVAVPARHAARGNSGPRGRFAASVESDGGKFTTGPRVRAIFERLAVPTLLALGGCIGISLVMDRVAPLGRTVPAFGFVAAMVAAALLGTWISFQRGRSVGFWTHRFINAACFASCSMAVLVLLMPVLAVVDRTTDHYRDSGPWPSVDAARTPAAPSEFPPAPAAPRGSRDAQALAEEARATANAIKQQAIEAIGEGKFQVRETIRNSVRSSDSSGTSKSTKRKASVTESPSAPSSPFRWGGPLLLLMVLGDWTGRVYGGRKGTIKIGNAVTAAIFAFVCAHALNVKGDAWTLAVIAGVASLAVEFVAGLWPMRDGEFVPSTSKQSEFIPLAEHMSAAAAFGAHGAGLNMPAGDFRTPPPMPGSGADRFSAQTDYVGVERAVARPEPSNAARIGTAPRPLAEHAAALPPLPVRSSTIRTLWLMCGIVMLGGSIVMFICFGMWNGRMHRSEEFGLLGGAVGATLLSLCTMTRAIHRRPKGLWRGVLRPYLMTIGLAGTAVSAIALGTVATRNDEQMVSIVLMVAGIVVTLISLIVPVSAYQALPAVAPEPEGARAGRLSRNYLIGGGFLMASSIFVGIMMSEVGRCGDDETAAGVIPIALCGVASLVAGGIYRRKSRVGVAKRESLKLPIKRDFNIPRVLELGDLIQRHFAVHGYKVAQVGHLLWSFKRGEWASQLWGSDVRNYRTTLNVAAYDIDGGYRLTCYADVQAGWTSVSQKDLEIFVQEIDALELLLNSSRVA